MRLTPHLALLAALTLTGVSSLAAIPAFPGAEGYGAYATGGRGGDVYHVTSLGSDATLPGTFAYGIATVPATGRTIVFDVSGYIRLPSGSGGTRLASSKVTIAGQTAPGDGVGFYNNFFRISGDDIVIRHLRFRHGKYGSGGDCIDLDSGCLNAILDHVSLQFSTDENISSFSSPPENLTLQYSLNAWGLESHSCGGLWDQNHATSHHNLWAHNHTRNPKARPAGLLEWVNNVTFDWDIGFIMGDSQSVYSWKANVLSNYFICPPGNTQSKALVKGTVSTAGTPNFTVFLSGNLTDNNGDGVLNGTDKGYAIVEGTPQAPGTAGLTAGTFNYYQAPNAIAGSAAGVAADSPLLAYKKIVSNAGALRMDAGASSGIRDEVDTILIGKLTSQTAFHVTRESDTGASASGFGVLVSSAAPIDTDRDGMPDSYESALGWNPAVQDHNTALAASNGIVSGPTFMPANTVSGYTRLEEYLHFLAIPHASVQKGTTSQAIDLSRYTAGFTNGATFTLSGVTGGTASQSGAGGKLVTFTAQGTAGRGGFLFTVTDADGSTWTQQFAVLVSNSGLPADLLWKGGSATNAWDTTVSNWSKGAAATNFSSGDRVTFDDTGSRSPAVGVPAAVTATTVEVDTAGTYVFAGSGGISTINDLTKRGSGTVTFSNTGANTFGSISLDEGLANFATNGTSGSGKISFNGGNVQLTTSSGGTVSNPFEFNAPATVTVGSQHNASGAWTGSSTVQVNGTSSHLWTVLGSWSGFTGRVVMGPGNVRLRFNNTSNLNYGSASVAFDLGSGSAQLMNRNGDAATPFALGSLEAAGAATILQGAQSVNGSGGYTASTYSIGGLNTSTTFAGAINNGGNATNVGLTHIVKVGTGALTLSGSNSYTGNTTVSNGWLLVQGSLANTPVTVLSNASLGGSGMLGGSVAANSGAFVSPGTVPFTGATMTVGGNVSLGSSTNGTTTLYYDMSSSTNGANDKIVLKNGGTLAMTGQLFFQFLLLDGVLGLGDYDLVTGATTSTANTVTLTHNLPEGARQTYALSRPAAGANPSYIRLTVSGTNPASLVWSGANNGGAWDTNTTANWTGGPTATFFQVDSVTFNDSSSVGGINVGARVSPRLLTFTNNSTAYTLGGTGSVTGGAQLLKSGTALLTIANSNSFTGGTTINAGSTIYLANDLANSYGLGTGRITFNGGTLSMYSLTDSYTSATYQLYVPAGQVGTFNADSRCDLYGALTGDGTFNFRIPYVRTTLFGDWSKFTGTINVSTNTSSTGDFRMGSNYWFPGFPAAALNLGDKVYAYYTGILSQGAGTTIEIGALGGTALSGLWGGPTAGRALTYRIGGRGGDATFLGRIGEQNTNNLVTSIVKTGAGTWTLGGACTHLGSTTVEQGTLRIAASGSIANTAPVTVASGATLDLAGGSVSVDGVTVESGGTLTGRGEIQGELLNNGTVSCGSGGKLVVTGDAVNNGTMVFTGGTALEATGLFVNNGTLDIMTGSGNLPSNLENNGVVLDARNIRLLDHRMSGGVFELTLQTYAGHTYKLQQKASLSSGAWADVPGQAMEGDGQAATFTATLGGGSTGFYRVLIGP